MSTQQRRPPIDLDELEGKKASGVPLESGKLTYVGGKGGKRVSGRGGKGPAKLLVVVVAAVVISIFATIQLAPSKAQLNEVILGHNALATQVAGLSTTLSTTGGRLDNTINSLAGYATKGEISVLATSDSVTGLSEEMRGLSSSLSSMRESLIQMGATLDSLEARMEVLEKKR